MTSALTRVTCLVALCALLATPAFAQQVAIMDYSGFGWETGGIPSSDPGDELAITAVAVQLDALFGVDLALSEATIYISGLISAGEFLDPISGFTFIGYVGGHIEVYDDSSKDHDWGTLPPNALLSTFTNGALLFEGDFTDFTLVLNSEGAGSYEGNIDGVGGTVAALCDGMVDCAYTFGGAFTKDLGTQIPEGYHLQINGTLEVDAAVSSETASFGAVKALFKN